ncbi:MAG TPA: methyltransferase domain-containing protein [Rhizobacter sp.]|nr:methyltransferase domain-containing protein [Rhizobacter sp.]
MKSLLNRLKGMHLKTRLKHPIDEFWDRRFGVHTVGFLSAVGEHGQADWRGAYVPTRYRRILHDLRHVGVGPNDVVVDLGSGLGRAVFAAAWLGAKRSVGVEIDGPLTAQAQDSLRSSRLKHRDISFVCASAEDYSLADTTVLFMFNPFGEGTMKTVIGKLETELAKRPRDLRIIYENPLQAAVLDASPYLERFDNWKPHQNGSHHPVSFWRSVDPATAKR